MNKQPPRLIQKSILSKGRFYFQSHLEIINSFFPVRLTPKEIEFLSAFMNKEGELVKEGRFNTIIRKKVKEELGLSDGGMGNYVKSLKEKGAIKEDSEGKLDVNPILFPNKKEQYYQFKLEKETTTTNYEENKK